MANGIKKRLKMYQVKYNLLRDRQCSKEEHDTYLKLTHTGQELPDNVYEVVTSEGAVISYRQITSDAPLLDDQERMEFLMYKNLELLRSIKNCNIFLVVVTAINLASAIIGAIILSNALHL